MILHGNLGLGLYESPDIPSDLSSVALSSDKRPSDILSYKLHHAKTFLHGIYFASDMAACQRAEAESKNIGVPADAVGGDAVSVSLTQQEDRQIIRTVTFDICCDHHCSWISKPASTVHLLIKSHDVRVGEVEQDKVKAISYAWGHFERTDRLIGHDVRGNAISLELGAEWYTEELINRLLLLSFEHGACWIDQLCIPQKDAEIRKALASVPTIYRKFDVLVLMPGAPCKCVRETLETLKVAYEFGTQVDYDSTIESFEIDRMKCFNMLLCSSWFNRLWTRQELLYSRRISMIWTSMRDSPCVKLGKVLDEDNYITAEHALDLLPFARLLHQQASQAVKAQSLSFAEPLSLASMKKSILEGSPSGLVQLMGPIANAFVDWILSSRPHGDTEAGRVLREKAENMRSLLESSKEKFTTLSERVASSVVENWALNDYRSTLTAFGEYVGKREEESGSGRIVPLRAIQFFAGEIVENGSENSKPAHEVSQLQRFLDGLNGLRRSGRQSTQIRDYVNSIWIDCPQYEVRIHSKDTDFRNLLEDALRQLHINYQIGLVTTLPGGLLGIDTGTGQWKPSLYLSVRHVNNAADIYGPLTYPVKTIPLVHDGTVPLRVIRSDKSSLSWMAVDYENHLAAYPTRAIFLHLKESVRVWPPDLLGRSQIPAVYQPSSRLHGPAIVGKMLAGAVSSFVLNFIRASFGGRETFNSELQERRSKADGELDARQQECSAEHNFRSQLLDHKISQWESAVEIKHFQVVYRMVTDALGIDYDLCRSRDLRLMVCWDPPRLGLADRAFSSRDARVRAGRVSRDSFKTVCMTHGQGNHGSVLYEVERTNGLGIPRYRVFGVWVPMRGAFLDDMYAIVEHGAADAYIV